VGEQVKRRHYGVRQCGGPRSPRERRHTTVAAHVWGACTATSAWSVHVFNPDNS
jgi:hypothetical protein